MKIPLNLILSAVLFLAFASETIQADAPASKPNIIFFLVDDLGWPDVGCYGSSFYETPAIDQLAKEGVKFDNAYATCHVCSPSRASILTGKYPARTDLTEWLGGKKEQDHEKLHSAIKANALPEGEITIAETLRNHGYATANYGKAERCPSSRSSGSFRRAVNRGADTPAARRNFEGSAKSISPQ
jgi:arylsulfatase A